MSNIENGNGKIQSNLEDILEWLNIKGGPTELRAFGKQGDYPIILSGFYDADHIPQLAADIRRIDNDPKYGEIEGFYTTLNPIIPELLSRTNHNTFQRAGRGEATTDEQITRRNWLFIDCDPITIVSKISATDEQKQAAFNLAQQVRSKLADLGFPANPMEVDSGNGHHLQYPIDLPNDDASANLIRDFLNVLHKQYSNEQAKVDCTVFNSSRLVKVPGTMVRKGSNQPDRPHRLSRLVERPAMEVVSAEMIKHATEQLTPFGEELRVEMNRLEGGGFGGIEGSIKWVRDFIEKHKIEFSNNQPYKEGECWELAACPFCDNPDSVITVQGEGEKGFKCQHNSCSEKHWKEFRGHFEEEPGEAPHATATEQGEPVKPSNLIVFEDWDTTCNIAASQHEDWLVPGWAEFGCLHLLTGLPFAGKSTIMADLIACAVHKRDWCEMPVQQVPFILLDLENKERILIKRIKRALGTDGEGDIRRLYHRINFRNYETPITDIFIAKCINSLRQKIGEAAAKGFIIVDTMRTAFCRDEMDPIEMIRLLIPLKKLADQTGWAVFVLHHNAKASGQYSGTTAIAAAADYLWNWQSNKFTYEATLTMEGRDDPQDGLAFLFDRDLNRNIYIGRASAAIKRKRAESKSKDVREVLQFIPADWLPLEQVKLFIAAGLNMNPFTIDRRLKDAAKEELIESKKEGQRKFIRLTPAGRDGEFVAGLR